MKAYPRLLVVLLSGLIIPIAFARAEAKSDMVTAGLPPLESSQRVLAEKSLRMGIDTLTYKRVSPPKIVSHSLPKAVPTNVEMFPSSPEPEPSREYRSFICSIVPYPQGVSEIQWNDGEGAQKRVFVHEDLTYLGASFGVCVGDTDYDFTTLNYGACEGARLMDFPGDLQRDIQTALNLPAGQFTTVPTATGRMSPPTASEMDFIDVMLAYYQVNRAILKEAREEARIRAEIEAEAKRIRDLTPKTIEIRLWPVTSQRYQTTQ